MPARTPIGVAMSMPMPTWIRLPTIALARPPFSPVGAIDVVSMLKRSAGMPRAISVHRIEPSTASDTQRGSGGEPGDDEVGRLARGAVRALIS